MKVWWKTKVGCQRKAYSHACMHVVSSLILVIAACRECQYKISKTTCRPFATEYTQVKHATRSEKAAGGIVLNEEAARLLHANVQRT